MASSHFCSTTSTDGAGFSFVLVVIGVAVLLFGHRNPEALDPPLISAKAILKRRPTSF